MATVTLQRIKGFAGSAGFAEAASGAVTGNQYVIDALGRVTVDTRDAPFYIVKGWCYWQPGSGGGTSPTSGVATLNFGAFPGTPQASVTVSAIDAADPNAEIDAWVIPVATTDHSADEHTYDPPRVSAAISGSTIIVTGFPSGRDMSVPPGTPFGASPSQQPIGEIQCMPYGQWSVAWAFSP